MALICNIQWNFTYFQIDINAVCILLPSLLVSYKMSRRYIDKFCALSIGILRDFMWSHRQILCFVHSCRTRCLEVIWAHFVHCSLMSYEMSWSHVCKFCSLMNYEISFSQSIIFCALLFGVIQDVLKSCRQFCALLIGDLEDVLKSYGQILSLFIGVWFRH